MPCRIEAASSFCWMSWRWPSRAAIPAQALDALERARALVDIEPAQRTVLFERSADVLGRAGRHDELERLLTEELARPELESGAIARARHRARCADRHARSFDGGARRPDVGARARSRSPRNAQRLGDARAPGRRPPASRPGLSAGLLALGAEPGQEIAWLRELAPLLDALGDDASALARWSELATLSPNEADVRSWRSSAKPSAKVIMKG